MIQRKGVEAMLLVMNDVTPNMRLDGIKAKNIQKAFCFHPDSMADFVTATVLEIGVTKRRNKKNAVRPSIRSNAAYPTIQLKV